MLRFLNNKKAQNTAEYAILIGVIVAAAIAMQVYVRRGMQARVKDGVDFTMSGGENVTGTGLNLFTTGQYEPYYMDSQTQTTSNSVTTEFMAKGGELNREVVNEFTSRTGTVTYGNWMEWNDTTP